MANESHEVDRRGYPVDPELRRLEFLLGDLAAEWRGAHGHTEKQDDIVRTYHQTLQTLYELGWDAELDVESHLPDQFMPDEYKRRNPPQRWTGKMLYSKKPQPPKQD